MKEELLLILSENPSYKETNLRAQAIYTATGFVPDMPNPCTQFPMGVEEYGKMRSDAKQNA